MQTLKKTVVLACLFLTIISPGSVEGLLEPSFSSSASADAPEFPGIERISVATDRTQGNDYSWFPSISSDGRYVAFQSAATTLVKGDTNENADIFVRDRITGITERISVSSDEIQGNGVSGEPCISADGRYVVFWSYANNLVGGDTNVGADVFLRDQINGITERVSVSSSEVQGDNYSFGASISADGRYVAFWSYASNLVSGQTDYTPNIFLHDRVNGTTDLISVPVGGGQSNGWSQDPSISSDGRFVALPTPKIIFDTDRDLCHR